MQSKTARRQFLAAFGLSLVSFKPTWAEDLEPQSTDPAYPDWQRLAGKGRNFEHWTPEEDGEWEWYRLERYVDGDWRTVGISLPINKVSGEPYEPADGYVSLSQIPSYVLNGELPQGASEILTELAPSQFDPIKDSVREPDPDVRSRQGKPPSDWLRSLTARDLKEWLHTVDAPEATVEGMTFWVHLVRDHGFDPRRIEGLTEQEFLHLHSAAHHGY